MAELLGDGTYVIRNGKLYSVQFPQKWFDDANTFYLEIPNWSVRKETNADRIRAMTDEELAEFLDCYCVSAYWECPRHHEIKCHECWLEWLKKEVEDG